MKEKYITTHEELMKLDGEKVTYYIDGEFIEDAKIRVEGGEVYVCQNEKKGARARNKLGYEYSWVVSKPFD